MRDGDYLREGSVEAKMRGNDGVAGSLFSYVDLEKRIRTDHPLRVILTLPPTFIQRGLESDR